MSGTLNHITVIPEQTPGYLLPHTTQPITKESPRMHMHTLPEQPLYACPCLISQQALPSLCREMSAVARWICQGPLRRAALSTTSCKALSLRADGSPWVETWIIPLKVLPLQWRSMERTLEFKSLSHKPWRASLRPRFLQCVFFEVIES